MGENSASDLFLQVWSSRYGQSSSQGRQTMTTPLTLLPTGQSSVASERVGKTRAEQSNPLASARSVRLFCVFSRPTSDSVRERPSPRAFRQRCHRGEGVACSRQRVNDDNLGPSEGKGTPESRPISAVSARRFVRHSV